MMRGVGLKTEEESARIIRNWEADEEKREEHVTGMKMIYTRDADYEDFKVRESKRQQHRSDEQRLYEFLARREKYMREKQAVDSLLDQARKAEKANGG